MALQKISMQMEEIVKSRVHDFKISPCEIYLQFPYLMDIDGVFVSATATLWVKYPENVDE